MTIFQARQYGTKTLDANKSITRSSSPALDADVLLQFVLQKDKTFLLFNKDTPLTDEQQALYENCIQTRNTGLPVAYITGTKEFFGYDFIVTPAVLIPKPDTEVLVEQTLAAMEQKLKAHPKQALTLCDMCTGSGCVGLSVLRSALDTHLVSKETFPLLTLVDISSQALEIARKNRDRLFPEQYRQNIRFVQSNLFLSVPGTFDIIMANPPYIPKAEVLELLKDGRAEPALALDGDVTLSGESSRTTDGLALMRNFIPQAKEHLNSQGNLLVEAGEYNVQMTEYLMKDAGLHATHIVKDYAGDLRCACGTKA